MLKMFRNSNLFLLIAAAVILLAGFTEVGLNQKVHAQQRITKDEQLSGESKEVSLTNEEEEIKMGIRVESDGKTIVFKLNESTAARSLYEQLPMTIEVENYSNNEKIFYPENKLDVSDTPAADAKDGTLGYYAPWGDVIMFYGDFGSASGLYELGKVVSGGENIASLSGIIKIERYQIKKELK
ncbi:cyclophilin-like fold protein [Halanaerobium kushneri]|uniref:Cyclophilin-like domain-containing protein n=1 Tax=Halanaerobium kushneri TaxID=56779 RepID=A0A1N6WQ50_9FIRM|nr:cyclophilin-like fold protein [Halanaerobium kushneri]SIQ92188.1 hypothetical protein SAMN05421834_11033 [Halanaerobium kushneri]